MKKVLFLITLSLISQFSFAQLQPGKVYLGGQVGLNISTSSNSTPSFSIIPYLGVMLGNKLSLDFSIGYTNNPQILGTSSTSFNVYNYKLGAFLTGFSLTQYIKLTDQFAFTISEGVNFLHAEYNQTIYDQYYGNHTYSSYSNILTFAVSPGAIYFPHKSFSVSANLGNFISVAYGVESKVAQLGFFNLSTSGPKIGASFWF